MEVAIGIQFAFREMRVETDEAADKVRELVDRAFADGQKVLWLTDKKGKQVAVPMEKLAYVEIGSDPGEKRVGFSLPVD